MENKVILTVTNIRYNYINILWKYLTNNAIIYNDSFI